MILLSHQVKHGDKKEKTARGWTRTVPRRFQPLHTARWVIPLVYRDRAGSYRFRLKARNGQVIGISEGYKSKSGCLDGIESVKENAPEE